MKNKNHTNEDEEGSITPNAIARSSLSRRSFFDLNTNTENNKYFDGDKRFNEQQQQHTHIQRSFDIYVVSLFVLNVSIYGKLYTSLDVEHL